MDNKYEAQDKWREKNLKPIAFVLNRKRDKELIEFIENNKDIYGVTTLMREALQLLVESKGGSMTPTYYREVSHNGHKAEMYDKDFRLIKVIDVFKSDDGTLKLKSSRGRVISNGLTRVVKKSDVIDSSLTAEPIKGTTMFLKVIKAE